MKFNLDKWKSRKDKQASIQERTQEKYEHLKKSILEEFGVSHEGELSEGKYKLFMEVLNERWAVAKTSQYHNPSTQQVKYKRFGKHNVNHMDIVKISGLVTEEVQYMMVEFTEPGYFKLQPVLPAKDSWVVDRSSYPETIKESDFSRNLKNGDYKVIDNFVSAANRRAPILEKEINSDEEFKEYAEKVLKKAHGDKYDQEIVDKMVDELKDKYEGDYGAMVGALQSGLSENMLTLISNASKLFSIVLEGRKSEYKSITNILDNSGVSVDVQNQVSEYAKSLRGKDHDDLIAQLTINHILESNGYTLNELGQPKQVVINGRTIKDKDIFHCDHQMINGAPVHYMVLLLRGKHAMVKLMKATESGWEPIKKSEYKEEPLEQSMSIDALAARIEQDRWQKVDNYNDFINRGFILKESKITSEKDFKDFAEKVLKKAHGDKYDQEIVDKMVDELKDKYKDDYGAMVGALTSGLAESVSVVLEKGITSIEDFKAFAETVLKKAHGDKYDQKIVDKMVDELKDKYKDDYGAMVGALTSGLGEGVTTPTREYEVYESLGETIHKLPLPFINISELVEHAKANDSLWVYLSERVDDTEFVESVDGYMFEGTDVKEMLIR